MQKFPTCEFYMPKYNFSLDQQLIPYLLAIGMSLKSVFIPAVCDIGTPDSYNDALQRVRVRFNKKALFLDRDGILLKPIPRKQYVVSVDHLMPEIKMKRVIAAAVVRDYVPIGVSNQPHVAKGLMWHAEAEAMRSMVQEIFDLPFSSFCPHIEEDECMCRKPRPSMLLRWETELGLDLRNSLLLGDSLVDAQAAVRVGVRPIILRHPYNGDEMEDMPRGTIFIDKVEDAVEYLI
jgi:histidinol-phosphate phosphatase family protein